MTAGKVSLPTVAIVMVTYNRARLLARTLECILAQTVFERCVKRVVVVDNASTDDTEAVLREIQSRVQRLSVVRTAENIGGAGGFALGIRTACKSGADWVGVLDDDVALFPDAVESILSHASPDRMLGCLRLDREGHVAERASRRYDLTSPFVLNPRQETLSDLYREPGEMQPLEPVAFCSFEGMFFPAALVESIGVPSREFFVFGDDCDYSIRARKAGMRIFIARDARLTRLIDYDRQAVFSSWKSRYVLRNFFVLHFLYGTNFLVRAKPWAIMAALVGGCFLGRLIGRPSAFSVERGFSPVRALQEARALAGELRRRAASGLMDCLSEADGAGNDAATDRVTEGPQVTAVVVTRNRRKLLCRCLAGIDAQTQPVARVIIVDNASSDESENWVRRCGYFERLPIVWLRLEENVGGAGGFHAGMAEALRRGTDYLWLMDDDGYPEKECLQRLLKEMSEGAFIGPLVLSDEDPLQLAFSFRLPGTMHIVTSEKDPSLSMQGVIENVILPFNGVLVSDSTVRHHGLPKREMFIWGDEIEYTWRLQAAGLRVALVPSARFRHPRPAMSGTPMFFSRLRFNDTDSDLKLYCLARNSFWNYRTYRGLVKALLFSAKAIWFYSFTKPSARKLGIVLRGFKDAFAGNFSRHIEIRDREGA